MGRLKLHWPQIFRWGTALFLFGFLVILASNFVSRSSREKQVMMEDKGLGEKKIEEKRNIVHFEIERETGSVQLKAQRHFLGEDGLYHLEGNVEVVFLKKREGKDVILYGEKIVYDKESRHFLLLGKGRMEYEDVQIESSYLEYLAEREIFKSDKPIHFTSDRLKGQADRFFYSLESREMELEENVRLLVASQRKKGESLILEGEKLEYNHKKGKGVLEGPVELTQGQSQGSAQSVEFGLHPEGESIRSLRLRGEADLLLYSTSREEGIHSDGSFFVLYQGKRRMQADEIYMESSQGIYGIRKIEAQGRCFLEFNSLQGAWTQIQAHRVEFVLGPGGELQGFRSSGRVQVTEQRKNQPKRVVEGESIELEGEEKILKIRGNERLKPWIQYKDYRIKAGSIDILLDSNNLEATLGVEVVLEPSEEENLSAGFFSDQSPVFITAEEMRYFEEKRRFIFKEEIRVWQGQQTLLAEQFELSQMTGEIFCSKGVQAYLPYKPPQRKQKRVIITAEEMEYLPQEKEITFQDNSVLELENLRLKAKLLRIRLKETKGGVQEIWGEEEVQIIQNHSEARGEKARMEVERESIVLSGNPVLIDENRGRIEGDKLTFHIPDDRIVIENNKKERSVTIIKSGK